MTSAIRSPNIWDTPDLYELENRASDRAGLIDAAIDDLHPWRGADVLDLGCGTGFHLPRFAAYGARVTGLEPHPPLADAARARVAGLGLNIDVLTAGAQDVPLPDASIDLIHARWAYFFGADCEPGLAEADRVLRPGGALVVVDNDPTRSTFGRWFTRAYPAYDAAAVNRFFDRHGFTTTQLTIDWTFDSRADLEAVTRIELPPAAADAVLADHEGLSVDYAVVLRVRTKGPGPRD